MKDRLQRIVTHYTQYYDYVTYEQAEAFYQTFYMNWYQMAVFLLTSESEQGALDVIFHKESKKVTVKKLSCKNP